MRKLLTVSYVPGTAGNFGRDDYRKGTPKLTLTGKTLAELGLTVGDRVEVVRDGNALRLIPETLADAERTADQLQAECDATRQRLSLWTAEHVTC